MLRMFECINEYDMFSALNLHVLCTNKCVSFFVCLILELR